MRDVALYYTRYAETVTVPGTDEVISVRIVRPDLAVAHIQ